MLLTDAIANCFVSELSKLNMLPVIRFFPLQFSTCLLIKWCQTLKYPSFPPQKYYPQNIKFFDNQWPP